MFMNCARELGLSIRPINHKDALAIYQVLSHPDVAKYNDYPLVVSKADARDLIQGDIEMLLEGVGARFAIMLDNRLIGTCGLFNIYQGCAELGFELHPDFWGRGLMQRALQHLFQSYSQYLHVSLQLLHARVHPHNSRCCSTLKALGFSQDKQRWQKKLVAD